MKNAGDVSDYSDPNHQPIVPKGAGTLPYCTCGVVGGRGIPGAKPGTVDGRPLLAHHLRDVGSVPISTSAGAADE